VTARVHEPLAGVDLGEIKVCDHFAFTSRERLADDLAFRVHDGGKTTAGNRPDRTTRILHDLGLLIGVEPRRSVNHEAGGFERVLADVDFRLLREQRAVTRSRIHGRVNLFAIGNQGITREGQVVLPAGELSNAPNRTVDAAQARAVALAPDHPLVIGWRDLAAALDQRAVRVEEKLREA
jgi:hypothetical protein